MQIAQQAIEAAITKVMEETGMERMQAYRHIQQRRQLQSMLAVGSPERRAQMILGKSALDE
jgi:hypothetical protein